MTGLETRLKTIPNLRTAPYVPDQVNPPQAIVGVPPIPNYHGAFAHGIFHLDVPVTVLVNKVVDRLDQPAMAAFADIAGTNSIHAAIEGDKTLGGAVSSATVTDFRPLGNDEVGVLGYYGGVFTIKIVCNGA